MIRFNSAVGLVLRKLAGRNWSARLAAKVRNHCDSIIGLSLKSGIDLHQNGELFLIRLVAPHCSHFVDVGANVGEWSRLFSQHMLSPPRGLSIEPSPDAATTLRASLEAASLDGVEVIQCAAGDAPGEARFFVETSAGETSSMFAEHSAVDARQIVTPVKPLDEILDQRGFTQVDMIKIDAEGFDFHVLRGARKMLSRNAIKVIQFEYNTPWISAGSTLKAAFLLLEEHGYKVRLLCPTFLAIVSPDERGEYFRYSNYVAYCKSHFSDILDQASIVPNNSLLSRTVGGSYCEEGAKETAAR